MLGLLGRLIVLFTLCGTFVGAAFAACPIPDRPVRVGVPPVAPFASETAMGDFAGFDVELWDMVAAELGCPSEFTTLSLADRFTALEQGQVDVVLGGVTITADREEVVDFSHPYFQSGQAVLAPEQKKVNFLAFAGAFWESTGKTFFYSFLGFVFLWGNFIWGVEHLFRKRNNGDKDPGNDIQFDASYLKGVFQAMYFVNVTMTTVGYGDYTPKTSWGRMLTMVMMWSGIAFGSVFLGAIVSFGLGYDTTPDAFTPENFKGKTIAVVAGTTGESASRGHGAKLVATATLTEAVEALQAGTVSAVVFDEPNLRSLTANGTVPGFAVSPAFTEEYYSIALSPGSALRDPVDVALLHLLEAGKTDSLKKTYFGN